MTVVLDNTRPRHPEKAHRPDAPAARKPDWIRVKAPLSKGYGETHAVVRANGKLYGTSRETKVTLGGCGG